MATARSGIADGIADGTQLRRTAVFVGGYVRLLLYRLREDKLRFCSRRVWCFTAHLLTSISRAAVTVSELSALVSNCVENCFDSICRSAYQGVENTPVRTQPTRAQRVSPHLPLRHALPVGWLQRIDFVLATKATLKVHDFEQAAVLDIYDHADLPRLHER